MTAPQLSSFEVSRWTSNVRHLEDAVARLERRIAELEREASRAKHDMEMALRRTAMDVDSQKNNLQLLVFTIVVAVVIAAAFLSRP